MRSLSKFHVERVVVASTRRVQANPVEFTFLSQHVDPLHSPFPLCVTIGRGSTPPDLSGNCCRVTVHILLEVGRLVMPGPRVHMRVKSLEEISDR